MHPLVAVCRDFLTSSFPVHTRCSLSPLPPLILIISFPPFQPPCLSDSRRSIRAVATPTASSFILPPFLPTCVSPLRSDVCPFLSFFFSNSVLFCYAPTWASCFCLPLSARKTFPLAGCAMERPWPPPLSFDLFFIFHFAFFLVFSPCGKCLFIGCPIISFFFSPGFLFFSTSSPRLRLAVRGSRSLFFVDLPV